MPRWIVMLALLLLAAGCATPGPVRQGDVHQGSVSLNGRAVPLPPGEWRVIGVSGQEAQPETPGSRTALGSDRVFLIQEVGGRFSGYVSIQASTRTTVGTAVYGNWEVQACARDAFTVETIARQGSDQFQDCAVVITAGRIGQQPANPDPVRRAFYDTAASRPGWAPVFAHAARIRIADRSGALDVIYMVSPETRGFARDERPWAQNGWNPGSQDEAKRAYLARLVAWARTTHDLAQGGFRTGSTGPAPSF